MDDEKSNLVPLNLDNGIYCYTFLQFYLIDDPVILGELVVKSFLAFMLQLSMIILLVSEISDRRNGWEEEIWSDYSRAQLRSAHLYSVASCVAFAWGQMCLEYAQIPFDQLSQL